MTELEMPSHDAENAMASRYARGTGLAVCWLMNLVSASAVACIVGRGASFFGRVAIGDDGTISLNSTTDEGPFGSVGTTGFLFAFGLVFLMGAVPISIVARTRARVVSEPNASVAPRPEYQVGSSASPFRYLAPGGVLLTVSASLVSTLFVVGSAPWILSSLDALIGFPHGSWLLGLVAAGSGAGPTWVWFLLAYGPSIGLHMIHVIVNDGLSGGARALWLGALFFSGLLVMPLYAGMFLFRRRRAG